MVNWKNFVNCIKKGKNGKKNDGGDKKPPKTSKLMNMSDILVRVPPNQLPQFQMFKKRNEEYRARVRKYPDAMPKIDWDYYRKNVRPEFVSWVKQFEQKYDKLDTLFVNRHAMISTRRYYEEVNKETEEICEKIREYKEESDKRIKALNEQLDILKAMMPYQDMTMEQFCQHRPHLAPDFINKPTFWPHTPEEQMPGPSDPTALHPEEREEPKEPPKSRPMPPAPAATEAKPKEKPAESTASPKKEEASKAVEEMTEKGTEMVKELALKVQQLLTVAVAKISEVAKQVHDAAASTRAAKAKPKEATEKPTDGSALAKSKPKSEDEDDDHYHRREHSKNICTQTIIRGEESQTNPDVKAKHVNLSIESDDEDDDSLEEKRKRCNEMESKRNTKKTPEGDDCEDDDDNDIPCKEQKKQKISECQSRDKQESPEKYCEERHKCEAEESESECEKKSTEKKEKLQFEDAANGDFANSISTCESVQKTKIIDKKGTRDPCKPQEKAALNQLPEGGNSSQGMGMIGTKGTDIFSFDQYPKEYKEQKVGATEGAFKPTRIWESDSQNLETGEDKVKESKAKARESDAAGDPITVYPRMEIAAKAKKTKSEPPPVEVESVTTDDLAKQVFDMAKDAASMLNEATISVEEAQKLKTNRIETLEAAYLSAHKQANRALAEAFKAVEAAKKLAKRSRSSSESQFRDHDAQAMAEKHALLAKMLVNRAVALKKEIAKVLEKLEQKE
ncbi:titin [Drosophila guanche]|uniref:Blast:ATP synthase subunit d, mitochondrial n=1 Tax=Drosophila guanche TaxID=7266 RepID=A0A3B0IYZ4_DROGU|nr:titin [Drosophila guanche]SPP73454.1 blast:ATP synthase subunit d%2C mitochondrial [Drosophila guanche]